MGFREVLEQEIGNQAYMKGKGIINPFYLASVEESLLLARLRIQELEGMIMNKDEGITIWKKIKKIFD